MRNIYGLDLMIEGAAPEQQGPTKGVQGNIRCKWIPSYERMRYMAIPRLLIITELGWGQASQKDWNALTQRSANQFKHLNIVGINYCVPDLEGPYHNNAFTDKGSVSVTCLDPSADTHYTTDGGIPTLQSSRYGGPTPMKETINFTSRTFHPNEKAGNIVRTRFIENEYASTTTTIPFSRGLKAEWYEFKGSKCDDTPEAPLDGTCVIGKIMIPGKAKEDIGLTVKGFISIPRDGVYTFALLSDNGSTLLMDGEEVISNDGSHRPRGVIGQKALAKGYHPIEVRYFDQDGG